MTNKRNIAVDIGNSRIKSAEFDDRELIIVENWSSLLELYNAKQELKAHWIFSSVTGNSQEIKQVFRNELFTILTSNIDLPITLDYRTPDTLGMDRIASVIGGQSLFPKKNILVIDVGTCITYDVLDLFNMFRGGIISPGIKMRMKAMHYFTKSLPDISEEWDELNTISLGKSTKECLYMGSTEAIVHEMNGFIEDLKKEFNDLVVLLTGGDASYFESKLKEPIFARSNLVLIGLNRILNYHQDAG